MIRDKNILLTHDCIKNSDMIIYSPGGSVISDRFFWRKQLEYLFPFACAKKYGKPFFIAAPSFGPYNRGHVLRSLFLSYPESICVREHYSYENLKNEGITTEIIRTCDLAFSKDINPQKEKIKLFDSRRGEQGKILEKYMSRYYTVVGITLTDLSWHVTYGKNAERNRKIILETFHETIDWIISKGYGIILIPQLFGNENDEDLLKEFLSEKTYLLPTHYDSEIQQYVISNLYALIGMRYHSNIFAAKVCTPFIPVVYEEKMQGFLDETELAKYSVPISQLSPINLKKKFNLLEKNYAEYRSYLVNMHEIWKARSNLTNKLLLQKMEDLKNGN